MHCSAYVSSEKTIARKDKGETYMSEKVRLYKRIRELREDNDLTQAQVAKKMGLYTTRYQTYERGEAKIPAQVVEKLARFYRVTSDYILELTNSPK